MATLYSRRFWYTPKGWFHWINTVCVMILLFLGLVMMYRKELGLGGTDVKVALKTIHVLVGYVFAANLIWRAILQIQAWLFPDSAHRSRVPRASLIALARYCVGFFSRKRPDFKQTNSLSRLVVNLTFILLTVQAITGIIRAGTDLYYPPLGGFAAEYVADSNASVKRLKPHNPAHTNAQRYKKMSRYKIPIGLVHIWSAYGLIVLTILHIRLASDLSTGKNRQLTRGSAMDTRDADPS